MISYVREERKKVPPAVQCDCCLDEWQVSFRLKYGTRGKLCFSCFKNYLAFCSIYIVTSLTILKNLHGDFGGGLLTIRQRAREQLMKKGVIHNA